MPNALQIGCSDVAVVAQHRKRKQTLADRGGMLHATGKKRSGGQVEHDKVAFFAALEIADAIIEVQRTRTAERCLIERGPRR